MRVSPFLSWYPCWLVLIENQQDHQQIRFVGSGAPKKTTPRRQTKPEHPSLWSPASREVLHGAVRVAGHTLELGGNGN